MGEALLLVGLVCALIAWIFSVDRMSTLEDQNKALRETVDWLMANVHRQGQDIKSLHDMITMNNLQRGEEE